VKFSFPAKGTRWSPGSAMPIRFQTYRFNQLRIAANGHSTASTKSQ
jgi:hypothetical protein